MRPAHSTGLAQGLVRSCMPRGVLAPDRMPPFRPVLVPLEWWRLSGGHTPAPGRRRFVASDLRAPGFVSFRSGSSHGFSSRAVSRGGHGFLPGGKRKGLHSWHRHLAKRLKWRSFSPALTRGERAHHQRAGMAGTGCTRGFDSRVSRNSRLSEYGNTSWVPATFARYAFQVEGR